MSKTIKKDESTFPTTAVLHVHPNLKRPGDCNHLTADNYELVRDRFLDEIGPLFKLSDALKECLADDRDMMDVLKDMVPEDKIAVIMPDDFSQVSDK